MALQQESGLQSNKKSKNGTNKLKLRMRKSPLNGIDLQKEVLVARLNRQSRLYFANNRVMSPTHCSGGMKRNFHIYVGYKASWSNATRQGFSWAL